ncbi:amidohydrolase [Bacillus shivajii]|uniref:amidohydrolase n=1 Tax=Bacillus shivajii TaxID=1983719 RepID=UPI001CFB0ED7|nr:amidohydrolase [Bacillus shivajii]UCZ52289.1 amidohydrolase [Bacillus shivajii]
MGTLWYGGKVRTLLDKNDVHEAVYVKDGIIQAVGNTVDLRNSYKSEMDDEHDLNGATMYPGFVDSHLHMIGHGEKLLRLDLSNVSSIEELKKILKNAVKDIKQGDWLIGEGFNENLFSDRQIPDRHVLDEVTTEHPVMLTRVCRHALVTNTYGLTLAKIDSETINPPGGKIEKDCKGIPTGYLHDQAQELIREVMPEEGFRYVKKALERSLDDLYRHGFVGAHSEDLNYYGDPIKTLETFYEVIDGTEKKFRTNLLVHHEVALEVFSKLDDFAPHSFIDLGSVKIFADGALGGRTALLSSPYADDSDTTGVAIHEPEILENIVADARKLDMPVAIHAIGDLALEYAINAIEKYPVPPNKRDRLIHIQVARKDLIERLKKLPVILDVQPRFVASDFPWVMDRIGKARLNYAFAWKTLLDADLICAGGSDAPIEPISPLLGIHAAVTRRKPEENHDGYLPEQKLSLFEAVKLFTYGSAQAICQEDNRGVIKVGNVADFTVLDCDLFKLEPDEWLKANVEKTIVDNTVMFERRR